MRFLPLVALLTIMFVPAAHAQRGSDLLETGNDVLRQCDEARVNRKDALAVGRYMRCVGYVQGFLEAHATLQVIAGLKPTYCYPGNADFGQALRITIKWLADNPAKSNLPISLVMEKAFIDAFPCSTP